MRGLLLMATFGLSACGSDGGSAKDRDTGIVAVAISPPQIPPISAAPLPVATYQTGQNLAASAIGWSAGPLINGLNRSAGTWLSEENNSLVVNIPSPNVEAGTANYITRYVSGLATATSIYIDFELIGDPGTKLMPRDGSNLPSQITLYFQRGGDNWYADAVTETYRWWASPKTIFDIQPGRRYTIRHRFDETWTAVLSSTSKTKPNEFEQARIYANQIGFTLGGGDGLGHGVYATSPARLVIHDFRIE